MDNNVITNLKNSIINKTTSLISSHNNNSTAHADMRILLNAKIDKSSTEGLVKNDGSIDTNTYLTSQDLTNYEITTNKEDKIYIIFEESEIKDDGLYLEVESYAIKAKVIVNNSKTVQLRFSTEYTVDWGDGNTGTFNNTTASHTYNTTGTYYIKINGNMTGIGSMSSNIDGIQISQITSLQDNLFKNSNLQYVKILDSLTEIGDSCFENCTKLKSVTFPDTLYDMGNNSFKGCTGLTSVEIPVNVGSMDDVFDGCTNIVDYQLYWTGSDIVNYYEDNMPVNENTVFTIPYGSTSDYVSLDYPSDKLVERE